MFNMLIADDEELERRTVKSIVLSNFKDKFNIYEAKNGREAIEIADRIKSDIVIIDIKMPGINGIEAIKEMKKFLSEGYFIILSAYDYFNYAKDAMECDVREYLLKPFKREELISQVQRALKYVEEMKLKRKIEIEMKEKVCNLTPVVENQLCYAIIKNDEINTDYDFLLECLNMKFDYGYCILIGLDEKSQNRKLKSDCGNYIKGIIQGFCRSVSSCLYTDDMVIFIEADRGYDNFQVKADSMAIGKRIMHMVGNKFGISINVGIGRVYNTVGNIYKSYNEARFALCCNAAGSRVRHFEDVSYLAGDENYYFAEDGNSEKQNSIISEAIEYIKENYATEITLEEVAGHVCTSPFYFSKIFKEYSGKNYVDYITEIRIKKAKDMLKSGEMNIKEICYKVGYNDPNYFSRVFKKIEGVSPSEFKVR